MVQTNKSVKMSKDLIVTIQNVAADEERTFSGVVRMALKMYLEKKEVKKNE